MTPSFFSFDALISVDVHVFQVKVVPPLECSICCEMLESREAISAMEMKTVTNILWLLWEYAGNMLGICWEYVGILRMMRSQMPRCDQ